MKKCAASRWVALLLICLLFIAELSACGKSKEKRNSAPLQDHSKEIDLLLSQMSAEEKIGQMVVIGFDGTSLNEKQLAYITKYHIGNVILFGQNITDRGQVISLNTQLQEVIQQNTGIPALIGIDQEGGKVTRTGACATIFPGNMAVAASGNPENARILGTYMGQELRALGFNVDFAPVLDVNSNPNNPVINTRSYSDNPDTVSLFGTQMADGLRSERMLTCAKHFPGHGDTMIDSHYGLPQVNKSAQALNEMELKPFQAAINDDIDMIMTAHILFPAYEPDSIPASMSKKILTGLLRDQLHFNGLIITDSMQMSAITENYGTAAGSVAAANAGADLILLGMGSSCIPSIPDPQADAVDALTAALQDGTLSQRRVDAAVRRILSYKIKLGLFESAVPDPQAAYADWSSHAQFSQQLSNESITLIQDRMQLLPFSVAAAVDLNNTYSKSLFLSPRAPGNSFLSLAEEAQLKFGCDTYTFSSNPTTVEINQAAEKAKKADKVILAVTDAKNKKGQQALVNRILAVNPSVILIGMGSPYDLDLFPSAGASLCTYDYSAAAIHAVLGVLSGELSAAGICPVQLETMEIM